MITTCIICAFWVCADSFLGDVKSRSIGSCDHTLRELYKGAIKAAKTSPLTIVRLRIRTIHNLEHTIQYRTIQRLKGQTPSAYKMGIYTKQYIPAIRAGWHLGFQRGRLRIANIPLGKTTVSTFVSTSRIMSHIDYCLNFW